MAPCACDSTSPTTAPTSTAGRPSRGCGPSRGCSRRRWPRCSASRPSPVTCAGRTDTGVHARGQVVHLDVDPDVLVASAGRSTDPPTDALLRRLNGVLPADVRVRGLREVPEAFDARFSAVWRRYAYRIADAPRPRRPAGTARRAGLAAAAGPRRHERGRVRAHRRARLRGVLQEAGGRDDRADAARPVLGPRRGRAARWPPSAPTRSATTWCARWSARMVAVGEGRRPPGWAAEVLARRRARRRRDRACRRTG